MAAPQPRSRSISFDLASPAATAELSGRLATDARPGDVIALAGDLGAGKTSFARAYINALLGGAAEEVPSPTFTLVQIYECRPAEVWHFDLYRIDRPEEVFELGFEEALTGAIVLIEWPERLGPLLPAERLDLELGFASDPEARHVTLTGHGDWDRRMAALDLSGLGGTAVASHE